MLHFTKMEGLGNDYIYLNCLEHTPDNLPDLAKRLSDRHFGVGADGLICICPSQTADVRMRMFNVDGSEGEMCGNGIRCVGKYVYDKGLVPKTELTVETKAGIKHLWLAVKDGTVAAATVDMGKPVLSPCVNVVVKDKSYTLYPVSVGNPHAVIFLPDIENLDLNTLGPQFECHPMFPHRTNVEFVQCIDRTHLSMRVWERGSGETMACGTGAAAVLAAAATLGRCERQVLIRLRGGELSLNWDTKDDHIYLTGPARTVFEGEIAI